MTVHQLTEIILVAVVSWHYKKFDQELNSSGRIVSKIDIKATERVMHHFYFQQLGVDNQHVRSIFINPAGTY